MVSSEAQDLILVVDDEPEIVALISYHLSAAGYEVVTAPDGRGAIARARQYRVALIVLDLVLPDMSGFDVLTTLRAGPSTCDSAFLMLTALRGDTDRIKGLERGADDYLTKPFNPEELVLRVKAILRRAKVRTIAAEARVIGELSIDPREHKVKVGNSEIDLTPTEFRLLQLLAENAGEVQRRNHLLRAIWESEPDMQTRTIDVHVQRLRSKLGSAGRMIETVRGFGYRLTIDDKLKP